MKTILSRLKTLIENNKNAGETLEYVKSVEIIHPEIDLTVHSLAQFPRVTFVPVSTTEEWTASQTKQAVNIVNAYLMLRYFQRETSIMGDSSRPSGHGKGIIDFVADFLDVTRGHLLGTGGEHYLDKPLDIQNVDYVVETLGENTHLLIAQITMQCTRIFRQTTIETNV